MKASVSACSSLFKSLDFKYMNNLYCSVFHLHNTSMFLLDLGGYNYDISKTPPPPHTHSVFYFQVNSYDFTACLQCVNLQGCNLFQA